MVTVNKAAPTHREDIFAPARMDSSCSMLPIAEVCFCVNEMATSMGTRAENLRNHPLR